MKHIQIKLTKHGKSMTIDGLFLSTAEAIKSVLADGVTGISAKVIT